MRHCADASSVKHSTWWKIHLKLHVYKGIPFISLCTPPIFPYLTYLIPRCKTFRLARNTALCGCKLRQICKLVKDPRLVANFKTLCLGENTALCGRKLTETCKLMKDPPLVARCKTLRLSKNSALCGYKLT